MHPIGPYFGLRTTGVEIVSETQAVAPGVGKGVSDPSDVPPNREADPDREEEDRRADENAPLGVGQTVGLVGCSVDRVAGFCVGCQSWVNYALIIGIFR